MADDVQHYFEPQTQAPSAFTPLSQATASPHFAAAPAFRPVVAPTPALSSGQRAISLFNEAKQAGEEHVTAFLQTLELAVKQAHEIVEGKEVYPAGVRDICEKLTEYTANRAQAIFSIMQPDTPERPIAPFEATLASLREDDLEAEMAEQQQFGRRGA